MDMKNSMGAPRMRKRSRRRNDIRSLLRSPLVQGTLLAGTALQAAVISDRLAARAEAETLPAVAARPVDRASLAELGELRLAQPGAATAPVKNARTGPEQLAEIYRRKGYRVSPALARQIHAAAVEHGIEPELAFGLVRTESGFRNSATSHVGATGLTQLMPATARWVEPGTTRADLRNSETNLRIGFRYLSQLIRKYDGDTTLALLAYNRGPGTVDRLVRRGRNPDNGYADMVRGLR